LKIRQISVYQVDLTLAGGGYYLSGGRLFFDRLDSTIVRVETDDGVHGWGESCPWGATYLPAHGKGVRAAMDEFAPNLLGMDPRRTDRINEAMDLALPGHIYAKSAIDMACWDILGKYSDLTLCDLLGGRVEGPVILHSSISTGTPEQMLTYVDNAVSRGYRIHSCKIGGEDIALDRARAQALAAHLPDAGALTLDVNRAWLPDQAIQVMNAVEGRSIYFEQPCETLDECLQVRRLTSNPIILDENIHTIHDIAHAWRCRICEAIGLKVGRVGGLTKARKIRDFCVAMGIRMNIEDTGGSVLADTAAVHLAQSTSTIHRRATWLCHDMCDVDIAPGQGARNASGETDAPDLPGIGVDLDGIEPGQWVAEYK